MISARSAPAISIREIQLAVAFAFNLTVREMVSTSRRRNVTCARQIAMYFSRELAARRPDRVTHTRAALPAGPPRSFPRIGIAFARDHSSVIYACSAVKRRLRDDLCFALLLQRLAHDLHDRDPIVTTQTQEAS